MAFGVQWAVVLILLKNPTQNQDCALKKRTENAQDYFSFVSLTSLINRPTLFFFFPTRLLLVLSYISNRQYLEAISSINNIPCSQQALYLKDDAYG